MKTESKTGDETMKAESTTGDETAKTQKQAVIYLLAMIILKLRCSR